MPIVNLFGHTRSFSLWEASLIVGTPVVIGAGIWYARRRRANISQLESDVKQDYAALEDEIRKLGNEGNEKNFQRALTLKNLGNEHFKSGRFAVAIQYYDKAIRRCPEDKKLELAMFYQNRAAAYEQLEMYAEAEQNCTEALKLNPTYTKALQRRAKACELNGNLQQSLEDLTALCCLENYQNHSTMISTDLVLQKLGDLHAREAMEKKTHALPSKYTIKSYFNSFTDDKVLTSISDSPEPDFTGFAGACEAFKKQNFHDVIPLCSEEIKKGGENKEKALLVRGAFYFLSGDLESAEKDLDAIIADCTDDKLRVNALIKRASVNMHREKSVSCLEDLRRALEMDPNCSDVYYHRSLAHTVLGNMREALDDMKVAAALNPDNPKAHVQMLSLEYRNAASDGNILSMTEAMKNFADALDKFPEYSECFECFAQILCDQRDYSKADEYFQMAAKLDSENTSIYVQRGLLHLQWHGDMAQAMELVSKAIELDDRCELAFQTLGVIEVQRGNLQRAIGLFEKAIENTRTLKELVHLFTMRDAAAAQMKVCEQLNLRNPDFNWPYGGPMNNKYR